MRLLRLSFAALLVASLVVRPARALDDAGAAHAIGFAKQQLTATAARVTPALSPNTTASDGSWLTVSNTDALAWTQAFFPGANWYLYDLTGDAAAKTRADQWTRSLEAQKTDTQSHDIGFKMIPSFAHAYRITNDPYYKDVLLTAAASLATRFDPDIGVIICCDWNPAWHRPIVVDTMMNLELLLWGAENGGPRSWREMATSHALKTLADMVRPDGGTFHVVDYSASGALLSQGTFQGYAANSTWTRGQAWAIYGYTMLYRYTKDARMLAAARKVTDFYLSRLGSDWVPNWDFDAPTTHKDSSAAAAVASALFELSGFVDGADRDRYLQAANHMLDELASPAYLAEGSTSASILLHGSFNVPASKGIDVGLAHGDYYFVEALARWKAQPASTTTGGGAGTAPTTSAPDGGSTGPSAATPTTPGSASAQGCSSGGQSTAMAALALVLVAMLGRKRLPRRPRAQARP